MKKNPIILSESQVRAMIKESVERVLREGQMGDRKLFNRVMDFIEGEAGWKFYYNGDYDEMCDVVREIIENMGPGDCGDDCVTRIAVRAMKNVDYDYFMRSVAPYIGYAGLNESVDEYAPGAEYDSSAPWREGEREPDVDPHDAEIEDMWRRSEDGDYDGFEILDENGEIRARVMAKDFPYPGDQKAFLQTLEMAKEIAAKEDIDVEVFGIFDGYTSDELVNDGGFPYDFLWASDYGFCKDKKLPVKMNESKTVVKLDESQLKKMVKESVKSVLNELASVRAVDRLRNMIIGEIGYLYNEGVVDYDDEHLEAMASGEIEPDYMDIARATYEDYQTGTFGDPEALEMLKSFISGNDEHRSVIINTIDDAIDYFVG